MSKTNAENSFKKHLTDRVLDEIADIDDDVIAFSQPARSQMGERQNIQKSISGDI